MSRASVAPQRNLTLTEELEKLEQSITLTLQEIDHNFNRAHRIVTTSILPIVEQYAKHSKDVWEGSKFWKQFFEASANVSLSGYEETPTEDETFIDETISQATPSSASFASPSQEDSSDFAPGSAQAYSQRGAEDASSTFSSPSHNTPRAPHLKPPQSGMAAYSSPYENLEREIHGTTEDPSSSTIPSTPRAQTLSESTPQSSPFLPPSTTQRRTPANDVLLHRVLDKNYRLLATPHTQSRLPKLSSRTAQTPTTSRKYNTAAEDNDDDLNSSPLMPAPELRSDIFGSAVKARRVPGVSVLTPVKRSDRRGKEGYEGENEEKLYSRRVGIWDSDSDDDDDGLPEGMSPPKTMQFHIPQSKLLKTPAREASKRIVEDLLLSAGGNMSDDSDDSPSVVKRTDMLNEDTF